MNGIVHVTLNGECYLKLVVHLIPYARALPWRLEAAVCREVSFEAAVVGGGSPYNERVADFGEAEEGAENLADVVAIQRGAIEHFGSAKDIP